MNAGETETQNTDNETEECLEIEIEYEWPAADYDRWAGGRSSSISYTPSPLDDVYKESEMVVEVVITEYLGESVSDGHYFDFTYFKAKI